MNFCERSAGIFMDTADALAKMSRETLVRATLPNFHLPAAVEILTTGSYSRVPRCIRDRIVPPEPITPAERRATLLKLNQVIEHRLVTSDLPIQMRNLKIEFGRVTFFVKHEFEATLTLMGDGPLVPWRLLKINILVEDKETGEGKALMHSMQLKYVEQLLQSRLTTESEQPLDDLYHILHNLCQALQLEVLQSQTQKLCFERLGDYIRTEEYKPGKCLTISYWRELMSRDPNSELGYRFSVQVDPHDPAKPLMVFHVPPLASETDMGEKAIRSDHISLERILVSSIYVRTKQRLNELKKDIQSRLKLRDLEATLHGSPAVLSIPILEKCLRSEQLLVTVDTHTGIFLAHVPQYEENPFNAQIQQALNEDRSQLGTLVSQLRLWITKQRVHKTLQQLPATSYERLPLLFDLNKHPLKDLSPNRMYIRLHKHQNAILIVEFHEKEFNHCEIEYQYYFLWVKPASIEDNPNDEKAPPADIPRVYLKALSMVQFDPFLVTHATSTKVDVQELSEKIIGKRKLGGKIEPPIKRTKFPAYFISDLAHVIAFTDERIPFTALAMELTKRGVAHSGVEIEDKAVGLVIKILKFPNVTGVGSGAVLRLQKFLLTTNVRLVQRGGRFWRQEFVFSGSPISGVQGRKPLHFTFEVGNTDKMASTVESIYQEWVRMVHIFDVVDQLEQYLQHESCTIGHLVSIKNYSFKDVVLEIGQTRTQLVRVDWKSAKGRFGLSFDSVREQNPHHLVREQLEHHLNMHRNLALLAKIMAETSSPLKSISLLPNIPQMGVSLLKINHPVETFVVLPQSGTHIKLLFYNTYCLDIQIRAGGLVYVRDGAISLFDQRKVVHEIQPIQGLKTFLSKYVDESTFHRRQSQTEDDNPPSPTLVGGCHEDGQGARLRFPTPHTPPSNPMTPASPLTGVPSSNNPGFLQSPPSNMRNPSPATLPQPSPSGQPMPSPSGFTVPSPINPVGSVGSPFPPAQSPMAVGSPGGMRPQGSHTPNQAQPSARILPPRLWAGAQPTPLTFQTFDELCRPSPAMPPTPGAHVLPMTLAPLHRFLGCLFLRRQLHHVIWQESEVQVISQTDNNTVAFKVEGLICRVLFLPGNNFQSLHLKLEPERQMANHWSPDMIQTMEKFFDTRVAAPPFRPNAVTAFIKILLCPIEPLKDIVNIMRYEMHPELVRQNGLKWTCRICLTVPPSAPPIIPLSQPGLLRLHEKMLLFLHIIQANVQLPPGQEPQSVVIPLVYDINMNQTTVAQKEMNPVVNIAQQHLGRLAQSGQLMMNRCTILPSVQDLLFNLTLPTENVRLR
eukprot:snap_masked-scaffold319_size207808-processed-gene-0.2 protein:Tk00362 transcript:snap_masked-scaffold319_size207808-processed-gene-0.2-mRNA-1 annotation:"mediator of rna polymerase ii transcription subunit 14"